jgi:flagellar basal-body rod protein FlgB
LKEKRAALARPVLSPSAVANLFAGIVPLNYALDHHIERHNLLASNIANVDTPGFKPKDLARVSEASFAQELGVAMTRTDGAHVADPAGGSNVGRPFTDATAGGGADGNFVSLDREASKLAANQLRYDVVSVLVSSHLKGLLWAANNGTD